MEVLNADLIEVDSRVYRVIPIKGSSSKIDDEEEEMDNKPRHKIRNRPGFVDDDDDNFNPDLHIIHQGDKFYIALHMPQQLIKHVVGLQHRHIKEVERNGAKVHIERDGVATITGGTRNVVSTAYYKIKSRVTSSRLREEFTHFVSLPVNSPNIQESFLIFKKEILTKHKVRGIDESIFQNPQKLHITIVPLVLLDERDKQDSILVLTKCIDNILQNISGKVLNVHVKGLEYMNDDPSEVDVLYAKVEELDGDDRVQIIADAIMKDFCAAELSRNQYGESVKLHITLMNTNFRPRENENSKRAKFDARSILKEYENFDFGKTVISEMHISARYTEAQDGYYIPIKTIKFDS